MIRPDLSPRTSTLLSSQGATATGSPARSPRRSTRPRAVPPAGRGDGSLTQGQSRRSGLSGVTGLTNVTRLTGVTGLTSVTGQPLGQAGPVHLTTPLEPLRLLSHGNRAGAPRRAAAGHRHPGLERLHCALAPIGE